MYRGNLDGGKVSQYQRAVTPTIDTSNAPNVSNMPANVSASPGTASGNGIRSKVLSYNPPPSRSNLTRNSAQMLSATASSTPTGMNTAMYRNSYTTNGTDISVQGTKSTHRNSIKGSETASLQEQLAALTNVPRYDLVPLADEIPSDGIIFAKVRYNPLANAHPTLSPDTLVVFRTAEERLRNPERLNLDRRQLEFCPLLEQEQRLRLLNYQNNNIKYITNLENLPNLIFLDLYNNKIITLEGPLCQVRGLRVLMAGKNRINRITNLTMLKKLDVLDLHSNEIKSIEGLDGLSDLRVLNLAGNKIAMVENLQSLSSLTELNLRRNQITHIYGLHTLPALQRIFLSHNFIQAYMDIQCIFNIQSLIELSLDNNPLVEKEGAGYRYTVLAYLPSLKHLDLKKVTDEERGVVASMSVDTKTLLLRKDEGGMEGSGGGGAGGEDRSDSPYTVDNVEGGGTPPSRSPSAQGGADGADKGGEDVDAEEEEAGSVVGGSGDQADVTLPTPQSNAAGSTPAPPAAEGATFEAKNGGGLAALARAGRIAKGQNLFDIEILGADEKVLIASGEKWDMNIPRKLLSSLSEIILLHIRRDGIMARCTPNAVAGMAALKTIRFGNNEFASIKQIDFIPTLFPNIEHVHIRDNAIQTNTHSLLRSYLSAHMPKLLSVNDLFVSPEERLKAEKQWRSISEVRNKVVKGFSVKAAAPAGGGDDDNAAEEGGGEAWEEGGKRGGVSSLASLLRNNNTSSLTGGLNLTSSTSAPLPWQVGMKAKKTVPYDKFSKDFDAIMFDIIKQAVKDIKDTLS